MNTLHWLALVLVIIGALNWGLVGLFQFNLVAALLGEQGSPLGRVVYTLVGLSGLVVAFTSSGTDTPGQNSRSSIRVSPVLAGPDSHRGGSHANIPSSCGR